MGQETSVERHRAVFSDWTVDTNVVSVAPPHAVVLHCFPAHRGEEISDEVIEGPRSRVWDQAENRLHVQKALLCFLLGVGDWCREYCCLIGEGRTRGGTPLSLPCARAIVHSITIPSRYKEI